MSLFTRGSRPASILKDPYGTYTELKSMKQRSEEYTFTYVKQFETRFFHEKANNGTPIVPQGGTNTWLHLLYKALELYVYLPFDYPEVAPHIYVRLFDSVQSQYIIPVEYYVYYINSESKHNFDKAKAIISRWMPQRSISWLIQSLEALLSLEVYLSSETVESIKEPCENVIISVESLTEHIEGVSLNSSQTPITPRQAEDFLKALYVTNFILFSNCCMPLQTWNMIQQTVPKHIMDITNDLVLYINQDIDMESMKNAVAGEGISTMVYFIQVVQDYTQTTELEADARQYFFRTFEGLLNELRPIFRDVMTYILNNGGKELEESELTGLTSVNLVDFLRTFDLDWVKKIVFAITNSYALP